MVMDKLPTNQQFILNFPIHLQASLSVHSISASPAHSKEATVKVTSISLNEINYVSNLYLPIRLDVKYEVTLRLIHTFSFIGTVTKRTLITNGYHYLFTFTIDEEVQRLFSKHMLDVKNDPAFKAVGFHTGIDCKID